MLSRAALPLRSLATALGLVASVAACGDLGPRSELPAESGQEVPAPPEGFPRFVQVSVGTQSACGLTADSTTLCWGASMMTGAGQFVPLPADVPKLGQIAVGTQFYPWDMFCGTTSTATVVCVGLIGLNGSTATVSNSSGLSLIRVGAAACALDAAGSAHCWTYTDDYSVLGLSLDPLRIVYRGTPVQVETAERFVVLSSGVQHSCGLTAAGEAFCWGYDFAHNLGTGNTEPPSIAFTPVRVATDEPLRAITAGHGHTCALTRDGRALCWGLALRGRLGRPDAPTVDCPDVSLQTGGGPAPCVPLPGPVAGNITFASITAGGYHTCGVDLAGRAWCWGSGTWGEIGNARSGADNFATAPQAVVGDLRFRSLVAGEFFTCGIAEDDATYCWGRNPWGQLGSGREPGYIATVPHPVGAR